MDTQKSSHNLFEVYLRLRPPPAGGTSAERILTVESSTPNEDSQQHGEMELDGGGEFLRQEAGTRRLASHIVLNPPTDRRRAIEKFGFTRVFEEGASQLDVFHCAEIIPLVDGVVAPNGGDGTDAMVATLGVTGSGKVNNIMDRLVVQGLLTSLLTDAHDSRLQVAARPDAASSRRSFPLS